MTQNKILLGGLAVLLLGAYNATQPGLTDMRTMAKVRAMNPPRNDDEERAMKVKVRKQRYGPDLEWLDRLTKASGADKAGKITKQPLDFRMMSSLMLAGLASGFKSQVANLLWMKSDEFWHKGMLTRQNPIMEAVVTLDPQFIEAWDTAGWHWAYNIYADLPTRPDLQIKDNLAPDVKRLAENKLQKEQDRAIETGLDYYARGTQMNPDKYLLWFKFGWTRQEKAGYNDEDTVDLFRIARKQPDARDQEMTFPDPKNPGQTISKRVEGIDLMGRTIGHAYERMPDIAKSLDTYAGLLEITDKPEKRALLREAGRFWGRYSSIYDKIAEFYQRPDTDAVTKAQIRKIIPDIDRLLASQKMRQEMAASDKGEGSQPTGAYVSMSARYLTAWELWQSGKLEEAARQMVAVMNADPKYHLQEWPAMAKVLELMGDSPEAIAAEEQTQRDYERESSQEIGLHILGTIYGQLEKAATDPALKKAYARMAYEMWYRARERDSLNFQARRMSLNYQSKYNFPDLPDISKKIRDSRQGGRFVSAAPATVPNVKDYLNKSDAPAPVTTSTPDSKPTPSATRSAT